MRELADPFKMALVTKLRPFERKLFTRITLAPLPRLQNHSLVYISQVTHENKNNLFLTNLLKNRLSFGQGQTVLHSKSVADMHLIRQPNDCGYCVTLRSEGSLKQLLMVGSQVRCH